jgi:hypothetical protein
MHRGSGQRAGGWPFDSPVSRLAADASRPGLGVRGDALSYVIEHTDVGVIEGRHGPGFLLEGLAALRVGGSLAREDLQRNDAAEASVTGAVNLTHPADAEQGGNLIWAESGTGLEAHRLLRGQV